MQCPNKAFVLYKTIYAVLGILFTYSASLDAIEATPISDLAIAMRYNEHLLSF